MTVKVLLRKHKEIEKIVFAPLNFNSTTETVINFKYDLDKSFQQILCKKDNWFNERSGCMTEFVDGEYGNISVSCPLSGSTYIELPYKLENSMKGLISIKNNDNKCFLCCYIRHLNSVKIHPERTTKADKNTVNDLDYEGIEFPIS